MSDLNSVAAKSVRSEMSAAVGLFVKTPGISPAKTRLARSIGTEAAEEFYRLSVEAVASVLLRCEKELGLVPYWAVAESGVQSLWPGFAVIEQGPGGLGERQSRTFDRLRERHTSVLLIGSDSPQLSVFDFTSALEALSRAPFALGAAIDGGYYLFASRAPIPESTWLQVPYSDKRTFECLTQGLLKLGTVEALPVRGDVDEEIDLNRLKADLLESRERTVAQDRLLAWLLKRSLR